MLTAEVNQVTVSCISVKLQKTIIRGVLRIMYRLKKAVLGSLSAKIALRSQFSKALTGRGIWARLNNKSNIV